MKVSQNEITYLCRKVFEGLGFSLGDYEDAAEMVAWLELHGLDGLTPFQAKWPSLTTQSSNMFECLWEDDSLAVLDVANGSSLLYGTLVIDLGYVKAHETGFAVIQLQQCSHPLYLLPYMVRCAKRGMNILAHWSNCQSTAQSKSITELVVSLAAYANFPTLCCYSTDKAMMLEPLVNIETSTNVSILFSSHFALSPSSHLSASSNLDHSELTFIYMPDWFREQFEYHRDHGIDVDEHIWMTLQELAKAVLVEATEESRRRGAGEEGG